MSRPSSPPAQASERSPLLQDAGQHATAIKIPERPQQWMHSKAIALTMVLMIFLASSSDGLSDTPNARILESILCYRYWEATDPTKIRLGRETIGPGAIGGVPERFCKVDVVQSQLASLRGWQQTFEGFPSLLLAIPFGYLADRYGRKPFMLLGMVAFVWKGVCMQLVCWFWQAFDVRLIWLSSSYTFAGGNNTTVAILLTILADITAEGERAAYFMQAAAGSMLSQLVMPPIAAGLMNYNPWIPSMLGAVVVLLSLIPAVFIPETLNYRGKSILCDSRPPTPPPDDLPPPSSVVGNRPNPLMPSYAVRALTSIRDATAFLTNDWRVPAIITTFACHFVVAAANPFLVQYISRRYEVTLSTSTLVLTVYNSVKVALLFGLLPLLSEAIMRCLHLSDQQKDLYLSRASQLFVVAGFLLVALSPNIPTVAISLGIASLGQGSTLLARSFLTSLLPAHNIARAYSIIAICETLGFMAGGPLLAASFKKGMSLGGLWIGLPWYIISGLGLVVAILYLCVGLRPEERKTLVAEGSEEECEA